MIPETAPVEPEKENSELEDEATGHQKDEEETADPEQPLEIKQYSGFEKRKYLRYNLVYPSKEKVTLIISDYEFEVLDISQGGLKFLLENGIDMEQQIQGIVRFSENESRAIEGKVVWKKDSYVGIKFNDLLPLFKLSFFC